MLLDIQAIYQELIIHHFYDIMNKTYNRGDFLKMPKSDNFILHFGVLLDSSKIRMNLTRDNYSIIDKNNYTKRRDDLLILLKGAVPEASLYVPSGLRVIEIQSFVKAPEARVKK